MAHIENNQATEFVYGAYFGYDFETEALPEIEVMEAMNSISTFCEYVTTHAVRCGYSGNTSDMRELATFITARCNESCIKLGSGTKSTIERWLNKGLPANTSDGRENVYKLCFALQMNVQQTVEFFLKAYLERPFNYKDIHEAVYFFCMNNDLTYTDAIRIISTVESSDLIANPYADNVTDQIGVRLAEIESEEELINYLVDNRFGFTQNQTATTKIRELVNRCFEIAPEEYEINYPYEKRITVNNIDELLSVIYGYSARATENAKPLYKKSISKSNFPELIKRNWPQREQFQQILDKQNASYDVIRRALIMLSFYDFYANALVEENKAKERRRKTGKAENIASVADGLFDEFEVEANMLLSACGYVQLYWRNPFDWMIGYCAMSPDPLRTLRNLIIEYYLNDPTVIEE